MANSTQTIYDLINLVKDAQKELKLLKANIEQDRQKVNELLYSISSLPTSIATIISILNMQNIATQRSQNNAFAYNAIVQSQSKLSEFINHLSKFRVNIAAVSERLPKALGKVSLTLLDLKEKYPQVQATIEQNIALIRPLILQFQDLKKEEQEITQQCENSLFAKVLEPKTIGQLIDTIFVQLQEQELENIMQRWHSKITQTNGAKPAIEETTQTLNYLIEVYSQRQEGISACSLILRTRLKSLIEKINTLANQTEKIIQTIENLALRLKQLSDAKKL